MNKTGPPAHLLLGKLGENKAAEFLVQKGYKILDRNWRVGYWELDIICQKNGEIFFIEVKTRKSDKWGGGLGAITENKKIRIQRAAQKWLDKTGKWQMPCHFDIICIYSTNGFFRVEHYRDAFELSLPMDSGHANWQLW